MDMFNCDDVNTLLAKQKQKFLSGFVHLDSILCQVVAMISNWYPVAYYYSYFIIVSIIILLLFVVSLSWWRIKDVCVYIRNKLVMMTALHYVSQRVVRVCGIEFRQQRCQILTDFQTFPLLERA